MSQQGLRSNTAFTSHRTLPNLPSASNTPALTPRALSTLRESKSISRSRASHLGSQFNATDTDRSYHSHISRSPRNDLHPGSKSKKFEFRNDESIFSRDRNIERADLNPLHDIDDNKDVDIDMAIPTIRIGSFKRARRHSLHSIHGGSRKERSISNKSVPTNILLIPPKTPSFGRRKSRNTPYSQVGDEEEESDDDGDEQFPAIKSNINDQTTGTDLSSNKINIFRRIRGHGFQETAGTDSDEHKLTEEDRTKLDTTNVTEFSKFSRLDLDLTITDNSRDMTASDQNWSSQKLGGGQSSGGNPSSGPNNSTHLKPPPSGNRPRAGSNTSTGRNSKYSMNDELNLQKMMMTSEMNANIDISEGETERDEFEEESNGTMESNEFNLDKEGSRRNDAKMNAMRTGALTKEMEDAVDNFELYIQIRNTLSWIAILTIAIMEFFYWRYYFLFGILNIITVLMYISLHFPNIHTQLSESFMCSFMLVVIRIFHITCIITIFSGVETCLFHYKHTVDRDLVNPNDDAMIQVLQGSLYGFITCAVIFAYFQNIFVIKYDEFVVYRWRLFYCCRKEYHITQDGRWRSDLSPYHANCDGLITFALLIFTWICVGVSWFCIFEMESIMNEQQP